MKNYNRYDVRAIFRKMTSEVSDSMDLNSMSRSIFDKVKENPSLVSPFSIEDVSDEMLYDDIWYGVTGKIEDDAKEAIKSGSATVLSGDYARELVGKKVRTFSFGYKGQNILSDVAFDKIMTEWDWAATDFMKDENRTRQEYWKSYMTEAQIDKARNTLCVINEDGYKTGIFLDKNGMFGDIFFRGDEDRAVYVIKVLD